jgi:endo-1,4-beta-xylanase
LWWTYRCYLLGSPQIMNRRDFLSTACLAGAGLSCAPCSLWGAAAEQEIGLLAQARERITQHRLKKGKLRVVGPKGKLLKNARVRLTQQRHEFLFGCNAFRVGRIQDQNREDEYRRRFGELLNYATLGFYWPMYEPERGRPIYEYTDRVLEWAKAAGISCKGHPLVWDFADPKWLPREFSDIRELSNARVRDIVSRFRGRLDRWDVVNEPTHLGRFKTRLGEWAISMGTIPYVMESLKIAREANPTATLLVNDYRTDPAFFAILDQLRDQGRLCFDEVGIQSHMHGGPWPLANIWEVCDRYARLGLPIHFTEATVVSGPRIEGERWKPTNPELEEAQAEYVPKFYTMLFAHPAVEALTWWDFSDDHAWQGAAAGLIRNDMSPKPVYDRLMALIRGEWWTKTEVQTDKKGLSTFAGYCGDYEALVTLPNGLTSKHAVSWKRKEASEVTVNVT